MQRKSIASIVALALVLAISACGSEDDKPAATDSPVEEEETESSYSNPQNIEVELNPSEVTKRPGEQFVVAADVFDAGEDGNSSNLYTSTAPPDWSWFAEANVTLVEGTERTDLSDNAFAVSFKCSDRGGRGAYSIELQLYGPGPDDVRVVIETGFADCGSVFDEAPSTEPPAAEPPPADPPPTTDDRAPADNFSQEDPIGDWLTLSEQPAKPDAVPGPWDIATFERDGDQFTIFLADECPPETCLSEMMIASSQIVFYRPDGLVEATLILQLEDGVFVPNPNGNPALTFDPNATGFFGDRLIFRLDTSELPRELTVVGAVTGSKSDSSGLVRDETVSQNAD